MQAIFEEAVLKLAVSHCMSLARCRISWASVAECNRKQEQREPFLHIFSHAYAPLPVKNIVLLY